MPGNQWALGAVRVHVVVLGVLVSTSCLAFDGVSGSSASRMWGTAGPIDESSALSSAASHQLYGAAAGQVASAEAGLLLGNNINVTSIGSQNIVAVTGNNNSVRSDQDADNRGDVSTDADVSVRSQ
jgi:hypothetical protein